MISKNFFKIQKVLSLNAQQSFNFSRFVGPEAKRQYKKLHGKFILTPYLRDDLHYDQINDVKSLDESNGIFKLADDLVRYPDSPVDKKGICMMMYQLALKGENQDFKDVFQILEGHLYKYKEQFSPRLVYGALYGSYKTNSASNYGISYFEEEFFRVKKELSSIEFVNIAEALSHNNNKSLSDKKKFIDRHLLTDLVEKYDQYKFNSNAQQNLIFALQRMEYYNKEIWEKMLDTIMKNKSIRNLKRVASIYELLQKIQKEGKFYRSLEPEIENFKNRLLQREDHNWLYNVEKGQYHTYAEIVKKAEQYDEKKASQKQQIGKYLHYKQENLEKFKLNKQNIRKVAEEIENKEKKQELENLIYEKFMLENMGTNTKQPEEAEDSKIKIESETSFHNLRNMQSGEELEGYNEREIEEIVNEEFEEQKKEMEQAAKQKQKKEIKKDIEQLQDVQINEQVNVDNTENDSFQELEELYQNEQQTNQADYLNQAKEKQQDFEKGKFEQNTENQQQKNVNHEKHGKHGKHGKHHNDTQSDNQYNENHNNQQKNEHNHTNEEINQYFQQENEKSGNGHRHGHGKGKGKNHHQNHNKAQNELISLKNPQIFQQQQIQKTIHENSKVLYQTLDEKGKPVVVMGIPLNQVQAIQNQSQQHQQLQVQVPLQQQLNHPQQQLNYSQQQQFVYQPQQQHQIQVQQPQQWGINFQENRHLSQQQQQLKNEEYMPLKTENSLNESKQLLYTGKYPEM
ncbi:hypothetical protein PPERSA_07486 [Pseudocohnilembus persalinus]|uniref:Uncharacterized protein n=1 Tax=Pseudocohnilembus persalinus TaxID=266149 RepID=A0A0V0R2E3_PSEPJ|nr:hypothetical protein PPERSA_07486 [Pseudocohnilembus persalinus]|eukprot:KRX08674.1 hypothetical protein PPERSA_07486 [Pseudocohnilembus persalinus]